MMEPGMEVEVCLAYGGVLGSDTSCVSDIRISASMGHIELLSTYE